MRINATTETINARGRAKHVHEALRIWAEAAMAAQPAPSGAESQVQHAGPRYFERHEGSWDTQIPVINQQPIGFAA